MSKSSRITLPFITGAANVGLGVCINEVSEQVLEDWNPPTLLVIGIAVLFGVLPFVANAVSERSEEDARTRWVWVAGLSITGFAVASLWMLTQWIALPEKVTEFLGYAAGVLFVFGVLFPPIALLLLALRQHEYREGEVTLEELNEVVYFQMLENEQIEGNEGLLELARIALFLDLIPVAYPQGIESQGTEGEETQAALLEAYVQRQLTKSKTRGTGKYTPEQTRHYLTWLAWSLKQQNQTDFYIEDMQPSLFATQGERFVYEIIVGLILGLILGLTGGLIGGLIEGLTGGLLWVLIGGLIGGLTFALIWVISKIMGAIECPYIILEDPIRFSRQKINNNLISSLMIALISGMIWDVSILIASLISGVTTYKSMGLIWAPILGLIWAIIRGISSDFVYRSKPNQGILESGKKAVILFPITLPATMLMFVFSYLGTGVSINLTDVLIGGLGMSTFISLYFGGAACIQHLLLRVMLWQKGVIPWNYSRFLTYAAELRLLNQVGGRYRFLHDKLREHFVGSEPVLEPLSIE
ncbi:hypothetical protein [Roseofilum sp. Guam]|uniref:hypothetical protein n=1 Tax=Roseofilum sp. Guam TaxID=2821502 RepID=UPI001B0A8974|nr:hypothetical protein [Roseofilum sp. Guam]MBP0026920.1 hypothetical protein [Roseofilum sp. Guam]